MRALMLSWEYPPHNVGGLGKHVTDLVPVLSRQGVEVHLLTPRWVGGPVVEEVTGNGSTVYRVDPPDWVDMADFFGCALRTNITLEQAGRDLAERRGPFDLVHVHDWLVGFAGTALKHAYRWPLVSTIHATEYGRNRGHIHSDLQRAISNVEWSLTYESWRVICCSRFMQDEIATALDVPEGKLDIIPNAVSTTRFDRLDDVDHAAFRARYAAADEKIIYYVGRIVYEKGLHVLVEAAPRILAAFPTAKFVIAGTGSHLEHVRARAYALGVAEKFYFAGFIPDADRDRLFKVADVAVFPSLYEPFGIVALEAMAAKTPVVASSVGGLSEVVVNHETGITVYPDSVDSLAWGVLHTLTHPEWAAARAANAYRVVQELYNWDRVAGLTRAVYDRVVAERAHTAW